MIKLDEYTQLDKSPQEKDSNLLDYSLYNWF